MSIARSGLERLHVIERLLTRERLTPYLRHADDDLSAALALYEWNARAAAEFLRSTGVAEVMVRNAVDIQLVNLATRRGWRSWLDDAPLDGRARLAVRHARQRATMRGEHEQQHGKVIAELGLGFWRHLVARRYLTSLWVPAIAQAFPHGAADLGQRQRAVDGAMGRLVVTRNRAAHHEPIYRRDLAAEVESVVTLVSWVDPDAAAWVAGLSKMPAVIQDRPRTTASR